MDKVQIIATSEIVNKILELWKEYVADKPYWTAMEAPVTSFIQWIEKKYDDKTEQ